MGQKRERTSNKGIKGETQLAGLRAAASLAEWAETK